MLYLLFLSVRKALSCPVFSASRADDLLCVVQCSEPHIPIQPQSKKKRGFISKDELVLEIFCKILGLMLDCHVFEYTAKNNTEKLHNYNIASKTSMKLYNKSSQSYSQFKESSRVTLRYSTKIARVLQI